MREYQTLPAAIEVVDAAIGRYHDAAAARSRFEQQLHLGVVPKRLKVTDADDRSGNRLLISDSALAEAHVPAESVGYDSVQHLELYLAHDVKVYFLHPLVPVDFELRLLVLEQAELCQGGVCVDAARQDHETVEYRLEQSRARIHLESEPFTRVGMRKSGDCADSSGRHLGNRAEFIARVDTQHCSLFGPIAAAGGLAGQFVAGF